MSDVELSDEELVKSGDIGTIIAGLFQRYEKLLYAHIFKLSWSRDKSFVDDILQETFKAFWVQLKSGKFKPAGPGTVKAYLYRIAENTTMAMNRKEKNHPTTAELDTWEKLMDELDGDMMASQPDQKELDNQIKTMKQLVINLDPEDRKLLLLYCGDKNYQDIQQEPEFRNIKLPTLRRRICDLKERLKEEYSCQKDKEI